MFCFRVKQVSNVQTHASQQLVKNSHAIENIYFFPKKKILAIVKFRKNDLAF